MPREILLAFFIMISIETKKVLVRRLVISAILGLIAMFLAGPLISYLVKSTDAIVASGQIASGFYMRLWVAGAFALIPWMMALTIWIHKSKPRKFKSIAIGLVLISGILYSFVRIFFAVQFYDFWKIEGVFQYVDLRYFNLGRHMMMGMVLGLILSIIVGIILKRKK